MTKEHILSNGGKIVEIEGAVQYYPPMSTLNKQNEMRKGVVVGPVQREVRIEKHNLNNQLFKSGISIPGNRLLNDIWKNRKR